LVQPGLKALTNREYSEPQNVSICTRRYHHTDGIFDATKAVMVDNEPKLVIEEDHVALARVRHHEHESQKRFRRSNGSIITQFWVKVWIFFTMKIAPDDMYCREYADKHDKWSYLDGWDKLLLSETGNSNAVKHIVISTFQETAPTNKLT
jgi:hypothetical protein